MRNMKKILAVICALAVAISGIAFMGAPAKADDKIATAVDLTCFDINAYGDYLNVFGYVEEEEQGLGVLEGIIEIYFDGVKMGEVNLEEREDGFFDENFFVDKEPGSYAVEVRYLANDVYEGSSEGTYIQAANFVNIQGSHKVGLSGGQVTFNGVATLDIEPYAGKDVKVLLEDEDGKFELLGTARTNLDGEFSLDYTIDRPAGTYWYQFVIQNDTEKALATYSLEVADEKAEVYICPRTDYYAFLDDSAYSPSIDGTVYNAYDRGVYTGTINCDIYETGERMFNTDVSFGEFADSLDDSIYDYQPGDYTLLFTYSEDAIHEETVETATLHLLEHRSDLTEGVCGEDATWEYDTVNKVLTIKGTGAMYDYPTIVAPGCQTIVVEDGITSIGDSSFSNLEDLTSVTLPNSLTTIGEYAFNGCTMLSFLTLPVNVANIGAGAFMYCENLGYVYMPDNVKYIADTAFIYAYDYVELSVLENSYAFGWAIDHDMDYIVRDEPETTTPAPTTTTTATTTTTTTNTTTKPTTTTAETTTSIITTEPTSEVTTETTTGVPESTTVAPTTKRKITVAKVTGLKVKNKKKKKAVITWKKAKNALKYQVQFSRKKNMKKGKSKYTKKRKITIKKLKKRKKYYFRVRGINGKIVGKWSAKKKLKIKR